MHALTLRNIPTDLFAFLRQDAVVHHRSLNRQAIAALDAYRQAQTQTHPEASDLTQKRMRLTLRLDRIRSQLAANNAVQTVSNKGSDLPSSAKNMAAILGFDAQGLPQ